MNREQALEQYPNLSHANLHRVNLMRANLMRANLSGANLMRANLSMADLRGAHLSRANLMRANLSMADLRGANLSMADLRGADLSGADLSNASLVGADFRNTQGIHRLNMVDPRGYEAIIVLGGEQPMVKSGCIWLTVPCALTHWGRRFYCGSQEIGASYVRAIKEWEEENGNG